MPLSTTIPTLIINPIITKMFRVQPVKYITINDISTERGMANIMITVMRRLRRKNIKIKRAKIPPQSPVSIRLLIASSIKLP